MAHEGCMAGQFTERENIAIADRIVELLETEPDNWRFTPFQNTYHRGALLQYRVPDTRSWWARFWRIGRPVTGFTLFINLTADSISGFRDETGNPLVAFSAYCDWPWAANLFAAVHAFRHEHPAVNQAFMRAAAVLGIDPASLPPETPEQRPQSRLLEAVEIADPNWPESAPRGLLELKLDAALKQMQNSQRFNETMAA